MNRTNTKVKVFKSLAILASSSFLAALSIILGKYLAIPGGNVLRFSFENLPIMFAGMAFGPFVGCAVGIVADLIGCVLVGYTVNPLITAGAACIGLISGTVYYLLGRFSTLPLAARVALSVLSAHLVGSVIVKTIGLAKFYDFPIFILMLWRLLNYFIVGVLEVLILWYLMKNKQIQKQINSMTGKIK